MVTESPSSMKSPSSDLSSRWSYRHQMVRTSLGNRHGHLSHLGRRQSPSNIPSFRYRCTPSGRTPYGCTPSGTRRPVPRGSLSVRCGRNPRNTREPGRNRIPRAATQQGGWRTPAPRRTAVTATYGVPVDVRARRGRVRNDSPSRAAPHTSPAVRRRRRQQRRGWLPRVPRTAGGRRASRAGRPCSP